MSNVNKIFRIIEELYIAKGLKRKEFEEKLNLPQSFLSELKSGRTKKPSADKLMSMSDFFGVPIQYILGGEEKNATSPNIDDEESACVRTAQAGDSASAEMGVSLDELLKNSAVLYEHLTEDERILLDNYRQLDDDGKKTALNQIMLVVDSYNLRLQVKNNG